MTNTDLQEHKESQMLSKSDNILIKVLLLLLRFLNFLFPKGNVHRFEKTLKFYFGLINTDNYDWVPYQKPSGFLYLDINSKPWYEADDYDVFRKVSETLTRNVKDIKNEWSINSSNQKNLTSRYESSKRYASLKDDDWGKFMLWKDGNFTKSAKHLFPKTVNILSELENYYSPFAEAVFMVLKPGVAIPAHHDSSNVNITCHLGIKIPENCAIRVGSETRNWAEGETLFFDQSFEHEVWNKSQEKRVVLLLNLCHPELTKIEKFLLLIVKKYHSTFILNK